MNVEGIKGTYTNANDVYASKKSSYTEEYRKLLEEKLAKQDEVIENGSTEEPIQVGGRAYTSEEWDEMLENFDATLEDLREQMRAEHERRYEEQLQKAVDIRWALNHADVVTSNSEFEEKEYRDFSTSKYEVVADNKFSRFQVYNQSGELVGAFYYSDVKIRVDASTGTQLMISGQGLANCNAMILDQELIAGFQEIMGIESLTEEVLTGYTLERHAGTGIRYLMQEGEEGTGGRILISSDAEREAYEKLAQTYLTEYPNLIANDEIAHINAQLEIVGLIRRTPGGILSVNRDGMSYADDSDPEKNWALKFENEYYETIFEFVRMHDLLGTDLSNYDLWKEFFEENEMEIERIWSDQELEQGYLNVA